MKNENFHSLTKSPKYIFSMPGDMNVVLPSLTPRQHAVPRRYEETRPVHIQGYAHTKIIGMNITFMISAAE